MLNMLIISAKLGQASHALTRGLPGWQFEAG